MKKNTGYQLGRSLRACWLTDRAKNGDKHRCPWATSQYGASIVELSIVGGTLVLTGLFTLQLGLVYHAKTTLNYATFEAARIGAVNNARVDMIKSELGRRLAPLQGGDGTAMSSVVASFWSSVSMYDPLNTKVEFLNPTPEAFDDWAVSDPDTGKRFIPANHLRHQSYDIGSTSGLSLRDANILKIQVTHGVKLRVPVVSKVTMSIMQLADPENSIYYKRDQWPLQSVATVRMQSDSYEDEVLSSISDTIDDNSGETIAADNGEWADNEDGTNEGNDESTDEGVNNGAGEITDNEDMDVAGSGDEEIDDLDSGEGGMDDVVNQEEDSELAELDEEQEGEIGTGEEPVVCPEGYEPVAVVTFNQTGKSALPESSQDSQTGSSSKLTSTPGPSQKLMSTSRFRQMVARGD